MPVEIKELVIRAVISEKEHSEISQEATISNQEVVQECVQQVLKILKKQNRR